MADTSSFETLCVHGGEEKRTVGSPVALPIVSSTSFHAAAESMYSAKSIEEEPPLFYTRWSNPTLRALERRLAALDGGEDAIVFASGMGAIAGLLFSKLKRGDRVVASDILYPGTAELLDQLESNWGVDVARVDTSSLSEVERALKPGARLVLFEIPASLTLRLTDVGAVVHLAHAAGAEVAVDATIATPIGIKPIALGADYVVHSLTKYACGHGDTMGGAVIGRRASLIDIRRTGLALFGAVLHPQAAWLIERSLHTLPARMRIHEANALAVASFLESHPRVERVFYPGLPSHPQHELARRQLANASGLLSFRPSDPQRLVRRLASDLEVASYAISLGKSRTVVFFIRTEEVLQGSFKMSEAALSDFRASAGEGLVRVSVGLECAADIIADLDRCLS